MTGRKLGGGRILGSGKGLSASHSRDASTSSLPVVGSPIPPSDTSIDLNSVTGSPAPSASLPDLPQDLATNISIGRPGRSSKSDSQKLLCPICNEEMLTLLQLNRHLDDSHQELPEFEQDEVKTWFDKQVLKAKRFQPLSIINQKLRGLDVFESNDSAPLSTSPAGLALSQRPADAPIDPDELITRNHWQKQTFDDICTEPACGTRLGAVNGSINCRNCGRLFCEEHTMYQMKLSRSANHEPVRGYWARVCETCYKSREGYNDHDGVLIDHTRAFAEIRKKRVERENLDMARLEKRLTKLTTLLANPPSTPPPAANGAVLSSVASLTGQNSTRKLIEQSVVAWEEDALVQKCPFCQQEFGSWTFRRHHSGNTTTEKAQPANGQLSVDVRICRDCNRTIFAKRDFAASLSRKPPDQRAYETLRQFERGIQQLMTSFQRTLLTLQAEPTGNPSSSALTSHSQIKEAAKIRKRLIDTFAKYDLASRRLRDLPTTSDTQRRLQKAVHSAASSFLHANMLPLKSVPQMLRRMPHLTPSSSTKSSLSPLRNGEAADSETASQASESTVISALETEEKDLREKLVVLEEQMFLVRQMVDAAKGARRFEEVTALARNASELEGEIERVKALVGGVEERWRGVYGGRAAS
ncbi:related to vacuolar segregation protein PEP7 [Cephalotrichum gorgonifer]|uniref:Related to vacuolar segregation protein PEP7 n=1 Tax=Cephalotrichum gorgonifer TaxID=2041049 RepID=A0AAE8MY59_9PEZI|nr:related to vacuolar segregation protein PEP7 [Cephalotrichum gorgonifer]